MELDRYNAPLIFGTVDCQGFSTPGSYSVTELAFKAFALQSAKTYVFRPLIPFNMLNLKDKATCLWQTNHYHQLAYDSTDKALPQSDVIPTIQEWYKKHMVKDRPFLAVMNDHMQHILKQAGIPYVACGGENRYLPPTKLLMTDGREQFKNGPRYRCFNHGNAPLHKIKVCAKEKAMYMEDCLLNNVFPLVFGILKEADALSRSLSTLTFKDADV